MKRRPAFTLIELFLVIIITAVLSTALAVSMQKTTLKANFDDQVLNIRRLVEEARGYSLSNYLVNDLAPAEYYLLSVTTTDLSLSAVADDGTTEELDSLTFATGYAMSEPMTVYYVPPYGEVCFAYPCDGVLTEDSMVFSDTNSTYEAMITIDIYGGFAEIEEL